MKLLNHIMILGALALLVACGSSTASSATPAPQDANAAVDASDAKAQSDVAAGADTAAADTTPSDVAAAQDGMAPADVASVDVATADVAACPALPVSASYTATNVSAGAKLTAATWQAKGIGGGATYIKSIKQVTLAAVTGAGPGKTGPCMQLDISITFKADPVVGTVYPIGLGADTANVDLNDFEACDVGKMSTWNAAFAPKKAGSVKLTAWDTNKVSVEFSGVVLPESTPGTGTFTLDGTFSSDCVKVQ